MLCAVPKFQVIGRNDDFHGNGFTGLHRNVFESAETLGSVVAVEFRVELNDLLSIPGTR